METEKNKTLRIVREEVQRIIGKDLDGIKDMLKGIDSQNKILIVNHNANVRTQEKMNLAIIQLVLALRELLSQPEHHSVIVSTIKEFLNKIK